MKRIWSALLALALFFSAFAGNAAAAGEKSDAREIGFRAVWVSTVYNLDYPSSPTTDPETLKKEADDILARCEEMGMNAVILQVRPCTDALYPSKLFPWSVYLTGDQDAAPKRSFDPLKYWIEQAHKRNIQLHAWLNPYRITKKGDEDFAVLSAKSPAKQHPEWVVNFSDNYYFDPGIPEVRKLVVSGVKELIDNYDIDGIHFDDYFYPGAAFDDAETFKKYGKSFADVGDFRRSNVTALISEVHQITKAAGIPFGVSPVGIWANADKMAGGSQTKGNQSYFSQFADTRKWVKEKLIDYICPQIYWNIGYEPADYEILVNWWANVVKNTGVKLYIGMADYKSGNKDENSPWAGIEEMKRQAVLNRTVSEVAGEVHFRYKLILETEGLADYYADLYHNRIQQPTIIPAQQPKNPDDGAVVKLPAKDGSGIWEQYADKSWSFLVDGKPVFGWKKIDGSWYCFDKAGKMLTGWFEDSDKSRYYLNPSGSMKSGWLLWEKNWYFFGGSGSMKASCWVEQNGKWYYLKANGVMAKSEVVEGYIVDQNGEWVG